MDKEELANNIKKFFLDISGNIISARLREKYMRSNHPEILEDLKKISTMLNIQYQPKLLVLYVLDRAELRYCETCNSPFLTETDKRFCSRECVFVNKDIIRKRSVSIKDTNRKKYGTSNPFQSDQFKIKAQETKLSRYGKKTFNNSDKRRSTSLEKYGVEYTFELNKTKPDLWTDEIRKRRIETSLKKYNFSHPMKCEEIKEKSQNNRTPIIKFDIEKSILEDLYLVQKKTFLEIANLYGVSYSTIQLLIYKYEIPINRDHWQSATERWLIDKLEFENVKSNVLIKTDKNYEVDILINDQLGIEINGLYWHSELFKSKQYHKDKTICLESKSIRLYSFYEDEVYAKTNIIISMLNNHMGNSIKIYGRSCVIVDVSKDEAEQFLNDNHIQGFIPSSTYIGLQYGGDLVCLMTFGRSRFGKHQYELHRFCNKLNTTVIGGASKLFQYFIKTHRPQSIISYSDRRYSTGNLYDRLNFSKIKSTIGYYYTDGKTRYNRMSLQKHKLKKKFTDFDDSISADKFLQTKKIYKIYDSGVDTWVWYSSNNT